MTRVVITDCDHDSMEPEQAVAEKYGVDLIIANAESSDDVVTAARDADAIVVQYAQVTGQLLDQLPQVKAVGRYGVGVDNVDVLAATERRVAVCNVADYGTEAVSDHAIGLALSVNRGIARLDRGIRAGSADFVPVRPLHNLAGRTFGIVGLGRIGMATARKARGLGYRVMANDILHEPGTTHQEVPMHTLDEVLEAADVVSLHVPLTDQTHHLLGSQEFARMKDSAVLINTSRGGVVDTAALVTALQQGKLYGAGLDVHEQEPLPADHALVNFDNVVLTPHTAWYTEESYYELKRRAVENAILVAIGERPRDIVNPEVLR